MSALAPTTKSPPIRSLTEELCFRPGSESARLRDPQPCLRQHNGAGRVAHQPLRPRLADQAYAPVCASSQDHRRPGFVRRPPLGRARRAQRHLLTYPLWAVPIPFGLVGGKRHLMTGWRAYFGPAGGAGIRAAARILGGWPAGSGAQRSPRARSVRGSAAAAEIPLPAFPVTTGGARESCWPRAIRTRQPRWPGALYGRRPPPFRGAWNLLPPRLLRCGRALARRGVHRMEWRPWCTRRSSTSCSGTCWSSSSCSGPTASSGWATAGCSP